MMINFKIALSFFKTIKYKLTGALVCSIMATEFRASCNEYRQAVFKHEQDCYTIPSYYTQVGDE